MGGVWVTSIAVHKFCIMLATLVADLCLAFGSFLIADGLIGSRSIRDSFIKAGLAGKDLNKTSESRV